MSGEWFGVGVGGQDRDARPTIEGTIKRNEKARNHAKVKGGRRREGGELSLVRRRAKGEQWLHNYT